MSFLSPTPGLERPRCRAAAGRRSLISGAATVLALLLASTPATAQLPVPGPEQEGRRITERIRALQDEAAQLARESASLVGELRQLEVERSLRIEEARQAERAADEAKRMLDDATTRIESLERQREAQLPDLQAQLVDLYKRGRAGYARLLFGVGDLREFARATRAVAAVAGINAHRLAEHRATLGALRQERDSLAATSGDLQAQDATAKGARAAAERAVAAQAALIARIDARRDLNATFTGELQVAYERLQQQVAALSASESTAPPSAGSPRAASLALLRGALPWPAPGDVTGRFGQTSGRLGGTAVRSGIEIAAPEDAPVRAVHAGTVAFSGPFTGFGTLVIVDHGAEDYSLYGYLGSTSVDQGQQVETGAELGRVGRAPAGPPALYFEMRIDGRSVDPLQWLERP